MDNIEGFLRETSELIAEDKVKSIANGVNAYKTSIEYVKDVEFWKWMKQNYEGSGIFDSAESIQKYISSGQGKAEWLKLQLQGKGYEWDWMMNKQSNIKNIFNKYDAGIDPTQIGIDVTERNIITGKSSTFQHKSYTSNTKIGSKALKNTPNDATVVTQQENLSTINSGGRKVEGFQSKAESNKVRDSRFDKASKGAANSSYTLKGVAKVTGKAAVIGAAIGCTVEALSSYKKYKNGELTKKEYLMEIGKSGGSAGVSAGVTAGIMIPIESAIVAAGVSIPITIPIAIAVGVGVDKIVAPMFKKGEYLEILNKMEFYEDIGDAYYEFLLNCENSAKHFDSYIERLKEQDEKYKNLNNIEKDVNNALMETYNRF